MMTLIQTSIAILWILRIGINIFSYVTLWFVKEYRPDRMIIHIKRTTQGKYILFPSWKLPPFSIKTCTLTLLLLLSEIALYLLLPYNIFIKLLIMDLTLLPLSFLLVALLHIPTKIFHIYKIKKAKTMLSKHQWKAVIGITGSYGKTSTKDFLSTILNSAYPVLRTEASKNSSIGISETVLAHLTPEHKMFVVEMGAYRKGEIQEMAQLVHPEVGIITAINAQHQDLFGSIETTMRAKYELLQNLVGKRIAIINADVQEAYTMGQWALKEYVNVWYVTRNRKAHKDAMFWIDTVVSDESSCSFTLHYKKEKERITVHIKGEHFVINISLAIAGAVAAGLTFHDACINAASIHPVGTVMQTSTGKHGEVLINDTFNNNPEAAIAALEYLAKFSKKKILVFQPMIELGAFTEISHIRVGKVAGKICDEIILTNSNFSFAFINGVHEVNPNMVVKILSSEQAAIYIEKKISSHDAVLFKGKEAGFVWKQMTAGK